MAVRRSLSTLLPALFQCHSSLPPVNYHVEFTSFTDYLFLYSCRHLVLTDGGYEVVFPCGFNFHFPDYYWDLTSYNFRAIFVS